MKPWLLGLTLIGVGLPWLARADSAAEAAAQPVPVFAAGAGVVAVDEAPPAAAHERLTQATRARAALEPLSTQSVERSVALNSQRRRILPWKLRVDVPRSSSSATRREAGVGLARVIGEGFRAGVDWRITRNQSLFEASDDFDRHVLGLYLRLDLR